MNTNNAIDELTQNFRLIQEPDSLYLIEITTSALTDANPRYALQEISTALRQSEQWTAIDPLSLVPLLLPVPTDGAAELINLAAKNANAKECLIAIQEAIENFDHSQHRANDITLSEQLLRLLGASRECTIRLQFRKKGPAVTLRPVFGHLVSAIELVSLHVNKQEGRKLLEASNQLVYSVAENVKWDDLENQSVLEMLSNFIFSIVGALFSTISSSLAKRRFALYYPKFVLDTNISEDAIKGAEIMHNLTHTLRKLWPSPNSLDSLYNRSHSLGKLILLAHEDPGIISRTVNNIGSLIPLLTSSCQQNAAVDEALALLLTLLCSSISILSQDIIDPLSALLTPLSASHPDPLMRHIAFKLLSVTLARSPPPLRLAHLTSLISDCPFVQMRVAAVELVKEAFLSASASESASLFNSPSLIRAVGPIIFRPSPPDIFENPSTKTLKKFVSSSESARLTACLSFYYVWLVRDVKNLTGIRDRDRIKGVESSLLQPLKTALFVWSEKLPPSEEQHTLVTLASLQISVDRVETAVLSVAT